MNTPTAPAIPAIQRFKSSLRRINGDEVVGGAFRVIGGLGLPLTSCLSTGSS
jgi:hypothetical protein